MGNPQISALRSRRRASKAKRSHCRVMADVPARPSRPHQDTMWWNIYRSNSGQKAEEGGAHCLCLLPTRPKPNKGAVLCPLQKRRQIRHKCKPQFFHQQEPPFLWLCTGVSLLWLALLVTCVFWLDFYPDDSEGNRPRVFQHCPGRFFTWDEVSWPLPL